MLASGGGGSDRPGYPDEHRRDLGGSRWQRHCSAGRLVTPRIGAPNDAKRPRLLGGQRTGPSRVVEALAVLASTSSGTVQMWDERFVKRPRRRSRGAVGIVRRHTQLTLAALGQLRSQKQSRHGRALGCFFAVHLA